MLKESEEYYEQFCANKLGNLVEMDRFVERQKLPESLRKK